ncbi:MAG: SUF system Fe-S cluster assembly regulator [Gammaproteobacteria bacterium]|nr:SUF system Fe-S cluster assembly regulator [Gammaproteobacteria bacterium]MCH9743612.1 SUF system Fe-S cluster assembly regulator [Gammaproteobacteria bacterium]
MLKISKLSDYAVLIMNKLGSSDPNNCYSASALSEQTGIATPTVSKILKQLQEAQLLSSSRGANGGYQLSRRINDITIIDVIEAIEGPPALTECSQGDDICSFDHSCVLKHNWTYINRSIYKFLESVSIADMNQPLQLTHVFD